MNLVQWAEWTAAGNRDDDTEAKRQAALKTVAHFIYPRHDDKPEAFLADEAKRQVGEKERT